MTEFIFYILKINLLAACGILVVILAGKALAEKYLPGWKVFLWLVFSVTLLIPVNLSSTTGIWRMQIPMREDQERQAEIVIPQQGIVPESDSVQESQAYVLETGSPQSQVLSEKGTEQQETSAAVSEQRRPPIEWFLWVWLGVGAVLTAGRIFPASIALRRLKRGSREPDEEIRRIYLETCRKMRLKKYPELAVNEQIAGPFLAGFTRPCIYLPVHTYSIRELPLIFEHELCHYRRKDLWLKLLLSTAASVYWFNPALLLMKREAERDIETLCDAAVAAGKSRAERAAYGRVLLKTAANTQGRKIFLSSGLSGGFREFGKRLKTIMHAEDRKKGFALALCTALVFTAGNLLTGCTDQKEAEHEVIYYKMDIPESTVSNKRLEWEDIPRLVLVDGKEFFWDYAPFGAKDEYGTCKTEGNILTVTSGSGEQWRFRSNESAERLTLTADGTPDGAEKIPEESVQELFVNGITFTREFAADTREKEDGSLEIITPYIFPVSSAATLSEYSEDERHELLQIPEDELSRLTDRILLETILDYPYGGFSGDIDSFAEEFNGMKEFLERSGAGEVLLGAFQEIGSDDTWERENDLTNLLVYFANTNRMSGKLREEFSEEVKDRASRGYTGCREYENPGGRTETVFLKECYIQPERMMDMLVLDPEEQHANIRKSLLSSTIVEIGFDKAVEQPVYEIKNDQLIIRMEDGSGRDYEYVFLIKGSTLIFDRTSSALPEGEEMEDGDVFE